MIKNTWIFFMLLAVSMYCHGQNQFPDSLLSRLQSSGTIEKTGIYLSVSRTYSKKVPEKALFYAQLADSIARQTNNDSLLTEVKKLKGKIYADSGLFSYAITNYKQAIEFCSKLNNKPALADLNNKLGTVFLRLDDYDQAIGCFFEALKLADESHEILIAASAQNNIGITCNIFKDYSRAIEYYQKASDGFEQAGFKKAQGKILNNIALIYIDQNKLDQALEYLKKSLAIKEKADDSTSIISTINNIGLVFEKKNEFDLAFDHYIQVYNYFSNKKNLKETAIGANNVGFIYLQKNDYKNAWKYLHIALEIITKTEFGNAKKIIYESLFKFYEQKKDYKNALTYHKLFMQMNDSLFSIEKENLIRNIEGKYENHKHLAEIELLSHNNELIKEKNFRQRFIFYTTFFLLVISILFAFTFFRSRKKVKQANAILQEKNIEINRQKDELIESNATKDKFFSIIAHDLRSPFTSFLGFTQLLVEELDNMTLEEIKTIVISMRKSATNVYSLLENLLEWSMMQRGITRFNPEAIPLSSSIRENLELIMGSAQHKELETHWEIPENLIVYTDPHMVATVIRNLYSNAVKFTPKQGRITISAEKTNPDFVTIFIRDTGIGMNKTLIRKLFRLNEQINRKGTEGEPSSGIGLLLCHEYIEKMGGKIGVESEEGKGSSFFFSLPLIKEKIIC